MLKRGVKKRDKEAVSEVVSTILLVALTVAMVAVVWAVVINLVREKTSSSSSCFDVAQGLEIKKTQTCYNSSSKELELYLSVGDVDIDSVLVSIVSQGNSFNFILNKTIGQVNGVSYNNSQDVKIPEKNNGFIYKINMSAVGLAGAPDLIQVAPNVGGNQCDVSDSLQLVESC